MKNYERLRVERERAEATQQQFADAMGISRMTYSGIEKGRVPLQKKYLRNLKKKYDMDVEEIFQSGEVGKTPNVLSETPNSTTIATINAKDKLSSSQVKPTIPFFDRWVPVSGKDVLYYLNDMNQQATERLDIFYINEYAHFATTILDHAMEAPYGHGDIVVGRVEADEQGVPDWEQINYGDVHVVHSKDKEYVRIVLQDVDENGKVVNPDIIILRASHSRRDRYQDITVKKTNVTLIAWAVTGMELNGKALKSRARVA